MTAPALCNFEIIARHTGFVLCFGFVLPVKARVRPHKLGVRAPSCKVFRKSPNVKTRQRNSMLMNRHVIHFRLSLIHSMGRMLQNLIISNLAQ